MKPGLREPFSLDPVRYQGTLKLNQTIPMTFCSPSLTPSQQSLIEFARCEVRELVEPILVDRQPRLNLVFIPPNLVRDGTFLRRLYNDVDCHILVWGRCSIRPSRHHLEQVKS